MSDAFAALATPPGRSALAIVRVAGAGASRIARAITDKREFEERLATPCRILSNGAVVDEVVALFWRAPRTPVGEDLFEIFCHGSPEIANEILAAALAAGARPAEPGEFTRCAFLSGKIDLAQAEAVQTLIAARGRRARAAAIERLTGSLSEKISTARAKVVSALAALEVRIDHPDDDIAPLSREQFLTDLDSARTDLCALLAAHERGKILRDGFRVCLIGRPNAGKSSLMNALLGRDRAIVAATPGTTRDVLEESIEFDGISATLVDTAGLADDPRDGVESEGIARARRALDASDVAVHVIDASIPTDAAAESRVHEALSQAAENSRRVVTAYNKCDLAAVDAAGGLAVSALTGAGIPDLCRAIVAASPAANLGDHADVAIGVREKDDLGTAAVELDAVRQIVEQSPTGFEDLAASRLREALRRLGAALGNGSSEEVLNEVFAKFCIGK